MKKLFENAYSFNRAGRFWFTTWLPIDVAYIQNMASTSQDQLFKLFWLSLIQWEPSKEKLIVWKGGSIPAPVPNYCWHSDGYDKLKPYGFPVHGCIDGYSRRIIWLKLTKSNNNPHIIASFFLESIKELHAFPTLLRTDRGTENGSMATVQCFLRRNHNDSLSGLGAHRYGSSHTNQRIEAWWSFLRKNWGSWWINFFKDMVDTGDLDTSNSMHMECLWLSFKKVIGMSWVNFKVIGTITIFANQGTKPWLGFQTNCTFCHRKLNQKITRNHLILLIWEKPNMKFTPPIQIILMMKKIKPVTTNNILTMHFKLLELITQPVGEKACMFIKHCYLLPLSYK